MTNYVVNFIVCNFPNWTEDGDTGQCSLDQIIGQATMTKMQALV